MDLLGHSEPPSAEPCPTCGLHPYDYNVDDYQRENDRISEERDAAQQQLKGAVEACDKLMGIIHADTHGGPRDGCDLCARVREVNSIPGGR